MVETVYIIEDLELPFILTEWVAIPFTAIIKILPTEPFILAKRLFNLSPNSPNAPSNFLTISMKGERHA